MEEICKQVCLKAVTAGGGEGCQHRAALGCRGDLSFHKGLAAEGGRWGRCPRLFLSLYFSQPQACRGIEFFLGSLIYVLLGLGFLDCGFIIE